MSHELQRQEPLVDSSLAGALVTPSQWVAVPTVRRSQHVVGLDVLRFLAALSVMAFHFGFWQLQPAVGQLAGLTNNPVELLGPFCHFGWVGVEVFFVISGYVIAFSSQHATRAQFAEARFLRLMPTIWLCSPIIYLLRVCFLPEGVALWPRLVRSMLFIPLGRQIDDVFWTLGVELAFYASVYVAVLPDFERRIERFAAALAAGSSAFWCACYVAELVTSDPSARWHALYPKLMIYEGHPAMQLTLLPHGGLFALGITIWLCTGRGVAKARLALGALATVASLLEISAQNALSALQAEAPLSPMPALLTWPCAVAFLVLAVQRNAAWQRAFARQSELVRKLGLMTFPLYLLHNAVGMSVVVVLTARGVATLPALALGIVASLIAAAASLAPERWLRTMVQAVRGRVR
jgi:peptidoglycan/LPS O-acetylase OafA/YrhL